MNGQFQFGAADTLFPRLLDAAYRNEGDELPFDTNGPGPGGVTSNTDYNSAGDVIDSDPRIISNLIVDQTLNNPATSTRRHGRDDHASPGLDGLFGTADDVEVQFIPNTAPDEGLSAPFNPWFTFFGQFFDHGLDLVAKGGNGTIFVPLAETDPLFVAGSPTNFMMLTRATQVTRPGADGILGTADDTRETLNKTTPFIDQNQTYTSHPSHQVFLREYEMTGDGPVATGRLITNHALNADGTLGADLGGMSTWAVVKAQARQFLGIELSDHDVTNIPLLLTDPYGKFIPGPEASRRSSSMPAPTASRSRATMSWARARRTLRSPSRSMHLAPGTPSWPTSRTTPTRSAARPARRSRRTPTPRWATPRDKASTTTSCSMPTSWRVTAASTRTSR